MNNKSQVSAQCTRCPSSLKLLVCFIRWSNSCVNTLTPHLSGVGVGGAASVSFPKPTIRHSHSDWPAVQRWESKQGWNFSLFFHYLQNYFCHFRAQCKTTDVFQERRSILKIIVFHPLYGGQLFSPPSSKTKHLTHMVGQHVEGTSSSYRSRDVPRQPLRTWQVGVGLPTAVTLISISQLKRVHGENMLQRRVKI